MFADVLSLQSFFHEFSEAQMRGGNGMYVCPLILKLAEHCVLNLVLQKRSDIADALEIETSIGVLQAVESF